MKITKKFEVLDFASLCWLSLTFLAFVALDKFFEQKLASVDENLMHNWGVSNIQMSKPIFERGRAF